MSIRSFARASLLALALSAFCATSASAVTIAGWDFSQYLAPGALTTDGATGADTLAANYSNLDPTGNAGAESAAFGTMYINGLYGSSVVDPFGAAPQFIPTDISLSSNLTAPVTGPGTNPFNSYTVLQSEGQLFANELGMTAFGAVDVVFGATLGSVPLTGADWGISFGARTSSGAATIAIDFSLNGVDYTSYGTVNIDGNDTPYNVSLGAFESDQVFIRMHFTGPGAGDASRAILDNVSVNASLVQPVPEPGAALLVGLGLSAAGVSALRRRRSRAC